MKIDFFRVPHRAGFFNLLPTVLLLQKNFSKLDNFDVSIPLGAARAQFWISDDFVTLFTRIRNTYTIHAFVQVTGSVGFPVEDTALHGA